MKKADKARLRQEIAELRHVGAQMANVFFNWSQNRQVIDPGDREMMNRVRRNWDAIQRAEKAEGAR